ncbi:hypothetical protein C8D87_114165 [Lentzea atacamensis]|uniref:Uncharacterized protein n=1 Tax=Lentzea atacamensis TaxID=531938 RepID=A0ABX9DYC6_9PSEU|nr:hypothetical protein [Lentzea atacamensis]RAS59553.1 hypothetical protein C8D87_114165 [Lentzea atacamensis]
MATHPPEERARARARLRLTTVVVVVIVVVGAAAAIVVARYVTTPRTAPAPPATSITSSATGAAGEENALAAQPMLQLPAQAAQPQAMTTTTAGPAITVPAPSSTAGRWIPGGFPGTAEGALGQLKALNETALTAADPQVYARGYRELAEPGAPDPGSTGLAALLRSMRSRAGLPATGSVAGLTATFQITHGQIKGTASGGRYAVVCVLGQFSVGVNGQAVAAGVGDCQAMRWNGTEWRIASGALAAAAPCAWPGSADAVKAGYRELN